MIGFPLIEVFAVKAEIINPTTDDRWDEFVARHQHGSVFHTSSWAKVISEAYNYLPRYFVLKNEAEQFVAGVPCFLISSPLTGRRLVCLPFSDYCYPLFADGTDVAALLDLAKKEIEVQKAAYLEIRGWTDGVPPTELGLVPFNYPLLYNINLESDAEKLNSRFHDSIRRCIRQAEKQNVTFRIAQSEDDLKEFYRLNVRTRKKLGVLPQPYAFFQSIFRHLITLKLGFIMLAEWENKIIASVLFLNYKDTIYYKFNASDIDYLRKRPNHLLIWEAIKYGCSNGYSHFDFGRCNPEEEGLRTFKQRWTAKEIDLPYYYYPTVRGIATYTENSLRYKGMKMATRFMPGFAFTATGSLLYRHLG